MTRMMRRLATLMLNTPQCRNRPSTREIIPGTAKMSCAVLMDPRSENTTFQDRVKGPQEVPNEPSAASDVVKPGHDQIDLQGSSEQVQSLIGHASPMLTEARLPGPIASTLEVASGQHERHDPVLPQTGGPAGNALLTAWTGLVLLVLSIAELLTLFNVEGLLSWHVAIGALLVPPALLKTTTTGWRMIRYYAGNAAYQEAGPPPALLRLLGPLVVLTTLTLLGSGILLVLLGQQTSHHALFTALGQRIDWVTVHQGAFIVWATATGLHLLGRIIPALRLVFGSGSTNRVPGTAIRLSVLAVALAVAAGLAVLLVHVDTRWTTRHLF